MPTPTRPTPERSSAVRDATGQARGASQPNVRPGQIWAVKSAEGPHWRCVKRIEAVHPNPINGRPMVTAMGWREERPDTASQWRKTSDETRHYRWLDRFLADYRLVQDAPTTEETTR